MRPIRHDGDIVADLAKGAIAGVVATWVMGLATSWLYEHEDERARTKEDEARGGDTAYGAAAGKAAAFVDRDLSDEERAQYGAAIHWALGMGAGAAYAAARGRVPGADQANGLLYGTAFWALIDEWSNVALGLTPGPKSFPWQTHARGLAGHLVFGVAADTTLRVLDRVA